MRARILVLIFAACALAGGDPISAGYWTPCDILAADITDGGIAALEHAGCTDLLGDNHATD